MRKALMLNQLKQFENPDGVNFDSPTERVFGTRLTGGPTDTKIVAGLIQNLKDVKDLTHGK